MITTKDYAVELITTGNELIFGRLKDTNSSWLAGRIWEEGGKVTRITIVGDEQSSMKDALLEAIKRMPKMIIVTGGLGPTFDDITSEVVANALNRKTVLDEKSLSVLKRKYETLANKRGSPIELTPQRKKMAYLVEGSEPIPNTYGFAAGMKIDASSTIIILPGVPKEMKSMFDRYVAPVINASTSVVMRTERLWVRMDNYVSLSYALEEIMKNHEEVFLKTYAGNIDGAKGMRVDIMVRRKSKENCLSFISLITRQIEKKVNRMGGCIFREE